MNIESTHTDLGEYNSELQGLLFETSPYGNLDAIVQHDHRAVYFYLNGDESFGTRACWVKNLIPGPLVLNQDEITAGVPPLMPKPYCTNNEPQAVPVADSLRIIWLEEGNGAALYEDTQLLAVIPPWSGTDGFHGYAKECSMENPIAWPLIELESLLIRIARAQEFWESCRSETKHPFAHLQPELLAIYNRWFGVEGRYFSLDGGHFPPRGAMLYRCPDRIAMVSVGMSLRPQPNVEMSVEHPADLRRIELGIELPAQVPDDQLQPLLEQFSGLVAFPWQAFTWFGQGHSCQFPQLQQWLACDTVRFEAATNENSTSGSLQLEFRGDPIQFLWLKPNL